MQNYDYGLASPRPNKLKNSQIRPQSQHRSSSLSHQDSFKKNSSSKIDANRHSIQISSANEYYVQQGGNARRPFRQFCQSNRSGSKIEKDQVQNMEKTRKLFIQKIQRWMIDLREQIHKQSSQIFNLERTIQQQNKEIETRNSIIKTLISKLQGQHPKKSDNRGGLSMQIRRIEDMEMRLSMIMDQIQEEKREINSKIQQLGIRLIKYFGKEVWKLKGCIFQFMKEKERNFQQITIQLTTLNVDIELKLLGMEKNIEKMQTGIKSITDDSFSKDTFSHATQKDSLSLGSQKSDQLELFKKDDSLFSDYFFYPSEKEMPNIKTMEQLVRQREELPIRVFVDASGRLKYWQSRTFIFDRKGNFTLPSSGELSVMEQRGWVKVIASD